jgi:hypothetical protein
MSRGSKLLNEYANSLDADLYEKAPKAVFAAVAVSALTCGGDYLNHAHRRVLAEWWALYENGIVPQRPPFPKPPREDWEPEQ